MTLPRKTVLVVDDDLEIRRALTRILSRMGLQALPAADLEEALGVISNCESPLRLAVINYRLPREDGLALCRRLRIHHPGARMILMTGAALGLEPALERALNDRLVDQVMEQPWKLRDLRDQVRQHLGTFGSRTPTQAIRAVA